MSESGRKTGSRRSGKISGDEIAKRADYTRDREFVYDVWMDGCMCVHRNPTNVGMEV